MLRNAGRQLCAKRIPVHRPLSSSSGLLFKDGLVTKFVETVAKNQTSAATRALSNAGIRLTPTQEGDLLLPIFQSAIEDGNLFLEQEIERRDAIIEEQTKKLQLAEAVKESKENLLESNIEQLIETQNKNLLYLYRKVAEIHYGEKSKESHSGMQKDEIAVLQGMLLQTTVQMLFLKVTLTNVYTMRPLIENALYNQPEEHIFDKVQNFINQNIFSDGELKPHVVKWIDQLETLSDSYKEFVRDELNDLQHELTKQVCDPIGRVDFVGFVCAGQFPTRIAVAVTLLELQKHKMIDVEINYFDADFIYLHCFGYRPKKKLVGGNVVDIKRF